MPSNMFFVCLPDRREAVPFDPFRYEQGDYPGFIEIDYLAGAFQTLERASTLENLTFYITWNIQELPSYGDDVVVVLMGDEWCRFPSYLGKVRAIFRSHNNWPMYTGKLADGLSYGNVITFLQFMRLHLLGLPGRVAYLASWCRNLLRGQARKTETYIIPLGYANQLNLPITPLKERTTDLIFMGSLNNQIPDKSSLKYWLQSPKNVAREQMLESAHTLQRKRPDLHIYLQGTEQFTGNLFGKVLLVEDEKTRYSRKMMNARICLVPRGSSLETFRLFEAVRYGCVAICDRLPERWYYSGLPAVQLDNWNNLEGIVEELLGNPDRMQRLHQAALDYWQTACSEAVLGRFIAEQLTAETTARRAGVAPSAPRSYEQRRDRP